MEDLENPTTFVYKIAWRKIGKKVKTKRRLTLVDDNHKAITYKKKDDSDKTLIFESRFESGNLCIAIK